MAKTTTGTHPKGSEWARVPIPGCYDCDAFEKCGSPLAPIPGAANPNIWNNQVNCYASCDGSSSSKSLGSCPNPNATQFPEAFPGVSGFGKSGWDWGILDRVRIPSDLEEGDYLLSWRWDCEQSTQVWQNCADIKVIDENTWDDSPIVIPGSEKAATKVSYDQVYKANLPQCDGASENLSAKCESFNQDACLNPGKKDWMFENCARLCCSERENTSDLYTSAAKKDAGIKCAEFAKADCDGDHKEWLYANCAKLCYTGESSSTKPISESMENCAGKKDISSKCGVQMTKADCDGDYKKWMHENCAEVCCSQEKLTYDSSYQEKLPECGETFKNSKAKCDSINQDECLDPEKKDWMFKNCAKLCCSEREEEAVEEILESETDGTGEEPEEISEDDARCWGYAAEWCHTGHNWMGVHCAATCAKVPGTYVDLEGADCEYYSAYCGIGNEYMVRNCRATCSN